jgi:glutamate synthase (NADPH/NADH) large chain
VLTTGMYERIHGLLGEKNVVVIDCTMPCRRRKPAAATPCAPTSTASAPRPRTPCCVAARHRPDRQASGPDRVALPMILATGGVQAHLVAKGLRSYVSIIVRSAECVDTHYFAVLVGVGATAVNAYLAQESFQDRLERGLTGDLSLRERLPQLQGGHRGRPAEDHLQDGHLVISSYRGGYNFEAVGLSRALAAEFFPGMPSRISGIGLAGLEAKAVELHRGLGNPDASPCRSAASTRRAARARPTPSRRG